MRTFTCAAHSQCDNSGGVKFVFGWRESLRFEAGWIAGVQVSFLKMRSRFLDPILEYYMNDLGVRTSNEFQGVFRYATN